MTTSKKTINVKRKNSAFFTGPKSGAGRRQSALNALKHGLFPKEPFLSEEGKPEFEALRSALRDQLEPATALQQEASELVACCCWRCRVATRLEMDRLKEIARDEDRAVQDGAAVEKVAPSRWYGASNHDLQAAKRFLLQLREDVEAHGWGRIEEWEDSIIKTFGQEFYDSLVQWNPTLSYDAILLAEALSAKSKIFHMPFPPELEATIKEQRVIFDPQLSRQMTVKLIDERLQHLEDLVRHGRPRTHGTEQRQSVLDRVTRDIPTATRDWEQAVKEIVPVPQEAQIVTSVSCPFADRSISGRSPCSQLWNPQSRARSV